MAGPQHDLAHLLRRIRDLGRIHGGGLGDLSGAATRSDIVRLRAARSAAVTRMRSSGTGECRHDIVDCGLKAARDEDTAGLAQAAIRWHAGRDQPPRCRRGRARFASLPPLHRISAARHRRWRQAGMQTDRRARSAPDPRSTPTDDFQQTRPMRNAPIAAMPMPASRHHNVVRRQAVSPRNEKGGQGNPEGWLRKSMRHAKSDRDGVSSKCESIRMNRVAKALLLIKPLRTNMRQRRSIFCAAVHKAYKRKWPGFRPGHCQFFQL